MSKPNSVEEKPQVRLRPIRQKNRGPGCPRRLFGDFFGVEKVTRPGGRNSPSPGRGGGQPPQNPNCGVRGRAAPETPLALGGETPHPRGVGAGSPHKI